MVYNKTALSTCPVSARINLVLKGVVPVYAVKSSLSCCFGNSSRDTDSQEKFAMLVLGTIEERTVGADLVSGAW
jgi:hypothetical protein